MDIQATISLLQSELKRNATYITWLINEKNGWLRLAKQNQEDEFDWRNYHYTKDCLTKAVHEQVVKKALYKMMCDVQKQPPNGIISMAQIREI